MIMEMNYTLLPLIKTCAQKKDLYMGIKLHEHIRRKKGLLETSIYLASCLISMYSKCGMLEKAHEVHKDIGSPNIFSWNALISAYTQHDHIDEALHCFERMPNEGLCRDSFTFSCIVKACGRIRNIEKGKKVHEMVIINDGMLENDNVLGNALVDMYAKCGLFGKAQKVMDEIRIRDVVSWNALIGGYAKHGKGIEALVCFEKMRKEGISPDSVTLVSVLKACGNVRAIDKGKQIHDEILERRCMHEKEKEEVVLRNALVDMYAKCGDTTKAREVLEELHSRDVITWNALIGGYVEHGQGHEALNCFARMQSQGICPDAVTFICSLKSCGIIRAMNIGIQIHKMIVSKGLFGKDIVLDTALVDMYAKCGMLAKAQQLLEELPVRSTVSWNALVGGYAQQRQLDKVLNCFQQMQNEGLSPDAVTFICVLNACGSTGAIEEGNQIHDKIVSGGLLDKDGVLGNALVNMYAKCGVIEKAEKVLQKLFSRDEVSWSALIAGYAKQGQGYSALDCFERMQSEGISPDLVTFISLFKACGNARAVDKGNQIHEKMLGKGLLEKNMVLSNALVGMYAKCGMFGKAQQVLHDLHSCDLVTCWNALIAGYAEQGQDHEALKCLQQMKSKGLYPDIATFVCCLKACGNGGAIGKGKQIHDEIASKGLLEKEIVLGNALLNMYAKCGLLTKAEDLLEELPARDIISWSTLIGAYAHQGQGHQALRCFARMQSEGLIPDSITLLCLLSACGYSGLFDEAQVLFGSMTQSYHGISSCLDQHTCIMMMILGYSGQFDKAIALTRVMPLSSKSSLVWLSLLSACRKWVNVKLGSLAFGKIIQLDKSCSVAYVFMADIFVAAGMEEGAKYVKAMRVEM